MLKCLRYIVRFKKSLPGMSCYVQFVVLFELYMYEKEICIKGFNDAKVNIGLLGRKHLTKHTIL